MNELHIQRALRTGVTFDTLLSRYVANAPQSWVLKVVGA